MQPLRRELLQSALGFYEGFLKERGDDPGLRAGLASALVRIGTIRGELGEASEAKKSFEKARALYQPLVSANAADSEAAHGLAQSLDSLERHEEAIAVWLRLVRPGEPQFQRELANAFNSLAISASHRGERAKALDGHQKSLAIREMLVGMEPDDPVAREELAGSLNNIGNELTNMGQLEQGLALYRRAADQQEKVCALTPQDPNNGRFLAVGLTNCAICEESLGRPEEAIRLRKRAVDVWKTTARDHPALPSLRLSLVAAYGSLVHSLATQGRVVEARDATREGIEQIERFPRDGAEDLFALAQARARSSEWHIWNVSKGPTEVDQAELRRRPTVRLTPCARLWPLASAIRIDSG